MRPLLRLTLAGVILSAPATLLVTEAPRTARAGVSGLAPRVALLATDPQGEETTLLLVDGDSPASLTAVASFPHLPYAVVRGAALPGSTRVVAIADTAFRADRSWASALVRLAPHEAPLTLATDLAHGSRPVLDGAGGVLVERGLAGPPPTGIDARARLRIDAIAVERIDPDTGAATTLYSGSGYTAHVAGVLDGEAFLSRVGPAGADLIAVRLSTHEVRPVVVSWAPMARDFAIDESAHALVVQQTELTGARNHVLLRLDAKTGASAVLAESAERDFVPFVLPIGGVSFTPEGSARTQVIGLGPTVALPPGGFFWGRGGSSDGAFALGLVVAPNALPTPVSLRMSDGVVTPLPHPGGKRVEIAGYVGGAQ